MLALHPPVRTLKNKKTASNGAALVQSLSYGPTYLATPITPQAARGPAFPAG